jgi:magnesium chelatase family protein
MTLARTCSVTLVGVRGHLIEVEADIASGLPATILVGLPDTALREARDRIRAAIVNSGQSWPNSKITVGLSPASLPKRGSGFDVAIAVAVLAADEAVPASALVPGIRVIGASTLTEVIVWLRGGPQPQPASVNDPSPDPAPASARARKKDLAEVLGQAEARLAAEICAAGGHNLSLLGPPGAGKTMLAERLPSILPSLDTAAALEVTSIHSIAGQLPPGTGLLTVPPYCAPHHTSSMAAIVGGGSGVIRPGAASLSHLGILLLDEAPEFRRDVLDALRQPLESGEVVIARSGAQAVFPARFTLVLASNPCPCAKSTGSGKSACSCSPAARRRYLARLSGPLLDRVDVKVRLQPVSRQDMLYDRKFAEPSAVVAARVAAARERCAARLAGTSWRFNAEVPGSALRRDFAPARKALTALDRAMELGQVSARGADKIVRVAWSLADLAGQPQIGADQVNLAIGLWLGVPR